MPKELAHELRAVDIEWQKQLRAADDKLDWVRAQHLAELAHARQHQLDRRFEEQRKWHSEHVEQQNQALKAALESSEKAITAALDSLNQRLVLLNELRSNVVDESAFEAFRKQQQERYEQILSAIAELRTDVAVGPSSIPALQASASEHRGAETQTQREEAREERKEARENRAATIKLTIIGILATFFGSGVFVVVLHAIGTF